MQDKLVAKKVSSVAANKNTNIDSGDVSSQQNSRDANKTQRTSTLAASRALLQSM